MNKQILNIKYVVKIIFNLPDGFPPFGDRLFQKMEWFTWPPPLNLIPDDSFTIVVTQPDTKF